MHPARSTGCCQALLGRYRGAARLSRDIDLQSTHPERSVDEARQMMIQAAQLELDDYLGYTDTMFDTHSEEGRGGAKHFKVFLGTALVDTIKVALVVGRAFSSIPEIRTLKSAVGLEWPVDLPDVRLDPVIDHVADKVCQHHGGNAQFGSVHFGDLADLHLISQQEPVPG